MRVLLQKLRLAMPLALAILVADCTTKEMAVESLAPERVPHEFAGDVVRLTLTYNPNAAMSLPLGRYGRWPLIAIGCVVLGVLLRLLWTTPHDATSRRIGLGLIIGGALGNLLSRLVFTRGVVDFIDIGVGAWRLWIFNVADVGIITGACLLALSLWREAKDEPPAESAA